MTLDLKPTFETLNKIATGAIAASGPRYTEVAHVDLDIEEVFDGLTRNEKFRNKLLKAKGEMTRAFTSIDDVDYFKSDKNLAEKFLALKTQLEELNSVLGKLRFNPDFDPNDLKLRDLVDSVHKNSESFHRDLYSFKPSNRPGFDSKHGFEKEHQRYEYYFRKFVSKIYEFHEIIKSDSYNAYCNPSVWITSAAGFGKTHLLCDFSKNSLREDQPVLFLLGQQIPDQDIWIHLCKKLKIEGGSYVTAQNDFLNFTKKLSEATNRKFVIVIDALNEGIGKTYWPERINNFRKTVSENSYLGLVVSCRSTYEHLIKASAKWNLVKHSGFEKNIFYATKMYFDSYKIVGHEIPLLGEFRNPLFLKTYCEALKGANSRILRGHVGIKWIHEEYFKKIDTKIAKRLNYKPGQLTTHLFSKRIALEMAQKGNEWVSFETFTEAVNSYQKEKSIEGDFQFELLNEGLFARDFFYDYETKENVESIRFGFQKFSDIFVARELLTLSNLTSANMAIEFSKSKEIKAIFAKPYLNQNLIEALAALVPEYTKGTLELIELTGAMAPENLLFDASLDSLVWRELSAYPKITKLKRVLGTTITTEDRYRKFLDTILSVSTTPNHPLNSNFLFAHLSKKKMPIRDFHWLTYLHYAYEDESVVKRTIDWAWNIDFKTISKQSLYLYAQTICWLFASSNRFIRDRATKALVLIFSQVPSLALRMTKKFINIDDDYIIERIIISSYGAFIRNRRTSNLFAYADYIYDFYYLDQNLPTNVSIRLYAKRIVILAKELGWKRRLIEKKLKPPFKSEWPEKISTKEELELKYKSASWDSMNPQWGYNAIHSSVMSWGDFARYEIGTDHESPWVAKEFVPIEKRKSNFRKILKQGEEKLLFDFLIKGFDRLYTRDALLEKLLAQAEDSFINGLTIEKKNIWKNEIKPFLRRGTEKPERLPLATIQHMIMDRIDSMGYSVELHGKFDRYISHGDSGRSPNKPERIGKKYQWISFFNVIGIVTDRYNHLRYDGHTEDPGMEEIRFIKHIDPTIAVRSYADIPHIAKAKSIVFPTLNDWKPELDNEGWLQDSSDFFKVKDLIYQKDANNSDWLLLDGGHSFQEETPPEEEKFSLQRRDIFYVINSCLYKKEDEAKVLKFLEKVDYTNRWMPESRSQIDPHFAEFSFEKFRTEMPNSRLCARRERSVPFPFSLTTEQYLYERGTYDCSMDETLNIIMPSYALSSRMNLSGQNFDGVFSLKKNSETIAFNLKGMKAHGFLFQKELLERFLKKEKLGIFWSILSEKRMFGGNHKNSPGRHDLSSSLIYIGGEFKEIGRKIKFLKYD